MAVREIEWPPDVTELARTVSGAAGPGGSWFWLDGEGSDPSLSSRSYLGVADEVRYAVRGREREFLAELRADPARWIVVLSYEFGVAMLGEDPAIDDVPPAFALRAGAVYTLDHLRGTASLSLPPSHGLPSHGLPSAAPVTEDSADSGPWSKPATHRREQQPERTCGSWRRSDDEYLRSIESCRASIREGDAYVLCLTDSLDAPAVGVDPLQLYLRLRTGGASARGGVVVCGDRALVSASPERFLSRRGKRIETHPIKGTRPRGADAAEDAILAEQLAADPKERAENLMIVDLMRNDLSRVCEPESVTVEGFLRVESHPRVHQLVSTVSGALREGTDVFDALEACFPGGSMTGAPKRRAVQLLAALEAEARGLYSGCFGWIDERGDADLAMTIRSIELRGLGTADATARVGAGGGVTADSDARAELAEKQLKAGPMLAALRACASDYD